MSKKRQFKNPYTILEKAKRGELGFENRPRLFSNVQYNVRGEIIKPYLHSLDERALQKAVDNYIQTPVSHQRIQQMAEKMNKKLVSPQTLTEEMMKIYQKFPKEVLNDIYNINYEDIQDLKFEERTEKNKFRYHMIEKSNNPIAKVITRQNNIKSMVYTRNMIQYYLMNLAMLQQEDKQAFDDLMNNLQGKDPQDQKQQKGMGGKGPGKGQPNPQPQPQDPQDHGQQGNPGNQPSQGGQDEDEDDEDPQGNGGGGDDEQEQEKDHSDSQTGGGNQAGTGNTRQSENAHLKTLMERFDKVKGSKQILEEVLEDARKTVEMLGAVMSEKQMDDMWKELASDRWGEANRAAEKTNRQYLEKVEQELRSVGLNLNAIKSKIKNLLDQSNSYFSAKDKPYFESIFDAGTLDGLEDITLLHPVLRKIFTEDILVKEIRKMGKIDLFIDASGSMEQSCGVQGQDGRYMTKLLFAKAFAFKMKELNMLNEVYSFQDHVKYEGNQIVDILNIRGGGGTTTGRVIQRIEANKRNAIVITDAEDHCSAYSDKAFFIGVAGAKFTGFNPLYQQRDQVIVFDGKRTYKVGRSGHAIK
jgi:hypothetical protein